MRCLVLGLVLLLFTSVRLAHGEKPTAPAVATAFLEEHRIHRGEVVRPNGYDETRAKIAATNDPETNFGPYVFALAKNQSTDLSDDQRGALTRIIEKRKAGPVNWHDHRNIVRMQAVLDLWSYVGETREAEVVRTKESWETWTDHRLAFMFQEYLAQERFQREAWAVLEGDQKTKLVGGGYESLIRKNVGHGRLFNAPKILRRTLGPPDREKEFGAAAARWAVSWEEMLEKYQKARQFRRKREFAMEEAGEDFALAAWSEYETEFRAFATMERDALRALLQAGYRIDEVLLEKLEQKRDTTRKEMLQKYQPAGTAFLRELGFIE